MVVAILVLVVVALPWLVNANRFRPTLETKLSKALGRPVKLGELKLSLLSGGVTASEVSIGDDPRFSPGAFLSAQSFTAGVDLASLLLSHELHVRRLAIDQPSITLLEDPTGTWNISSVGLGSASAAPKGSDEAALELSVKVLSVTHGKIVVAKTHSKMKPEVFDNVEIQIQDFAPDAVFPFALSAVGSGGAVVKLAGKAGPLNSANAAATPVEATIHVTHLDLARSGFLPATGFAGVVALDGDLSSNGALARIKGNFQADKLVLARHGIPAKRQVSFDFDLQHDIRQHAGTLDRGTVHIGAAQATLSGTYQTLAERDGESTMLNVKLSGPAMPIPDLEAMLPALDIILPSGSSFQGGTASAYVSIAGPTDRLILDGTLGLNNTRLSGYDLGSKLAFMAKLAGIQEGPSTEIQSMSMNIHIDPDGVRTENVSVRVPQIGDVAGAGTVSASHALDFNMTATVRTGGVLAVMGSNTTVPFKIQGTSTDPKFEPNVGAIAVDKLKQIGGTDVKKAAAGLVKGFLGSKK